MKKLAKVLLVVGAVVVVALSAIGCRKTTECDGCGKKASCAEYELLGEEVWFCRDCEDQINELKGMLD